MHLPLRSHHRQHRQSSRRRRRCAALSFLVRLHPLLDQPLLQFVAEFPASTWTLRLDDPGLEEEFHAVFLKKTRNHLRVILPVLLIASLTYLIAGAITTPSSSLRYFLPAILTAQVLLMTLGVILLLAEHQEALNAKAAATSEAQKSSSDATSPRRHSELLSSPPILRLTSFFNRHDQVLIGAVVCGVMICCNMSALYVRSHGGTDFQSSGDGSLISNFETLTNFNCLSMMVIFFIMRLYYRTAWIVALVVWADLILVYSFSGSSSRSSGMSLCVVLVCTLLSAYAQYHREYTSRFDFLLERVLMHEKNNLFQLLQNMLPSPRPCT